MIFETIAALLSGGLVGFSLGLVGGGGSILAVPLLLYVVGVRDPHVAIGTSALAVSLNAFVNLIGHWRAGTVHWPCAIIFGAAGATGAAISSTLGKQVPGDYILILFALVMIAAALMMLRPRQGGDLAHVRVDARIALRLAALGLAAGMVSGFFGIGGGFLIVPGLVFGSGMAIINAIGSSLFAVGAFGLTTAVNYAISGLVAWNIAALFIAGGAMGGYGGMRAAIALAPKKHALNRLFAAIMCGVALFMLARTSIAMTAG